MTEKEIDLVLGGGGVKGIALAGAVIELAEAGYRFRRVAGTSAGAVAAALIAAYQRSSTPLQQLEEDMHTLRYGEFIDAGPVRRITGRLGDAVAVACTGAAYSGKYFATWLGPKLAACGVTTFADLRLRGAQGAADGGYSLVVHATDLTRRALVRLPWDYGYYDRAPDEQSVVEAVHASMAIPFFFRQVRFKTTRGKVSWVDGGLVAGYPITTFDHVVACPARPVWGVRLSQDPPLGDDRPVRGASAMAVQCLATLSTDWNRYSWVDEGVGGRTIFVDTRGVASTDFRLSTAEQHELFAHGRAGARRFLAGLAAAAGTAA